MPQSTPGAVPVGDGRYAQILLQNPQPGHQGNLGSYTMYTVSRWNLDANLNKDLPDNRIEKPAVPYRLHECAERSVACRSYRPWHGGTADRYSLELQRQQLRPGGVKGRHEQRLPETVPGEAEIQLLARGLKQLVGAVYDRPQSRKNDIVGGHRPPLQQAQESRHQKSFDGGFFVPTATQNR